MWSMPLATSIHQDLRRQLTNGKKSLRTNIEDAHRKDYFFQIHNKMMEKQLRRPLDKTAIGADTENSEPVMARRTE